MTAKSILHGAAVTALTCAMLWPISGAATAAPPSNNLGTHAVDVATVAPKAQAALTANRGLLKDPGLAAKAVAALQDNNGDTHVRMNRTYQGLPVRGGDFVLHLDAKGQATGQDLTQLTPISVSTKPTVGSAAATNAVATKGRVAAGSPVLTVDATTAQPRLVWDVTTTGYQADGQTPSRLHSYVDANSGKVVATAETITTVNAVAPNTTAAPTKTPTNPTQTAFGTGSYTGTGNSLYAGSVALTTTSASGKFLLEDPSRAGNYTGDMNNGKDSTRCQNTGSGCVTLSPMSDADNTWGTGTKADRASAAVDAQYGVAKTWDYYQQTHQRAGVWNTGKGSWNRVHYGVNYVNAFWDGSKMTYGDGDGVSYGALTSLDVAGHEMSHGVTGSTANLTYSGESGGLNEATSDIFGTMVEFHANNTTDQGDYYIGEQFDLKNHLGLRRMDNPASDGSSANCWSSSVGQLDVHYSSGVGNHFYYLLAEGSGAKTIGAKAHSSPTCDGSVVTGIGRDKAEQVWYRALTVYMTSSTNYSGARTATIKAAGDLYGTTSPEAAAVASAWNAVSVK
ncbi:M4 family metallopeptidase [Pseudarthrobacter sp. J1738]|uniref:M4 family metallopeptidase n=1 Tax=unclassified Pseudarthrobacter TaxID=2647000 RepID=UPI003D2BC3F2